MAAKPPPERPKHLSSFKGHQQLIENILYQKRPKGPTTLSCFEKLPAELIYQILFYLPAHDLAVVSTTCRILAEHSESERLWAILVNSHLATPISDPGPFPSFRRLYLAHLPYWFIPEHKVWFADCEHTGKLILARYDNQRGVIEAYQLLTDRVRPQLQHWPANPDVIVHAFQPTVKLWLDDPVLFLQDPSPSGPCPETQAWMNERQMSMAAAANQVYSSLVLCSTELPYSPEVCPEEFWPPLTIPSNSRVFRKTTGQVVRNPRNMTEATQFAFRVRRRTSFRPVQGAEQNEVVVTYATLDPALYQQTQEKPYQGIWVGDYSAHGCEFILIFQEEHAQPSDSDTEIADQHANENIVTGRTIQESHDQNPRTNCTQKGRLVAVKLTGDPNVPRGEITFVADDIGPNGLLRVADESPFAGARIVRSAGHVAGLGFHDDTFTASQLILISPDFIGHYWEEMGHVSYYRRVDIDALLQW